MQRQPVNSFVMAAAALAVRQVFGGRMMQIPKHMGAHGYPRRHQIGPGRKTLYTYHKNLHANKYTPAECRARGCR